MRAETAVLCTWPSFGFFSSTSSSSSSCYAYDVASTFKDRDRENKPTFLVLFSACKKCLLWQCGIIIRDLLNMYLQRLFTVCFLTAMPSMCMCCIYASFMQLSVSKDHRNISQCMYGKCTSTT